MKLAKLSNGEAEVYSGIQGEASTMGEACVFVRLFGCNCRCSWCDSKHAWGVSDKAKENLFLEMTPEEVEIMIRQKAGKIRRVVFTGGEPLLQQDEMYKVIELLRKEGEEWLIEIETNGTVLINGCTYIDRVNCSPKLSNSGNPRELRNKPAIIQSYLENRIEEGILVCFKFVVGLDTMKEDLKEIRIWEKEHNVARELIYLMPEGITEEKIREGTKNLVEVCKKYGYKLSTRLHILLYGNARGT